MIAVDASLLIAHLARSDRHHEAATAILLDAVGERLVIHSVNLAEVLVAPARAGRAQEVLDDLIALGVEVAPRRDDEALRLAEAHATTGLKLPDCASVITAAGLTTPLATFDRRLAEGARGYGIPTIGA